jgi:hypothetical protein
MLIGNGEWVGVVNDLKAAGVEAYYFEPLSHKFHTTWTLEYGSLATVIIPAFFDAFDDIELEILARYRGTGKLLVWLQKAYPFQQTVLDTCEHDGTPVYRSFENLIDALLVRFGKPRKYNETPGILT